VLNDAAEERVLTPGRRSRAADQAPVRDRAGRSATRCCTASGLPRPAKALTMNISSGGVWFSTESVLATGMPVELSMNWPVLLKRLVPDEAHDLRLCHPQQRSRRGCGHRAVRVPNTGFRAPSTSSLPSRQRLNSACKSGWRRFVRNPPVHPVILPDWHITCSFPVTGAGFSAWNRTSGDALCCGQYQPSCCSFGSWDW